MANKNFNSISIIELNCNGMRCKLTEIKKLVIDNHPDFVCFNETWLNIRVPVFRGYDAEWNNRNRHGGGTGILIRNNIPYMVLDLVPFQAGMLEVQAISFTEQYSREKISLLNFYNPSKNVTEAELLHYVRQLGNRFIIVGDLNAHTPILDNKYHKYKNQTGVSLENVLINENIILLNPQNMVTYLDRRNGRPSCLDIAMVSPNLALDADIVRITDVGSDHSPLLISLNINAIKMKYSEMPKKWKIKNVNWNKWRSKIESSKIERPNTAEKLNEDIVNRIINCSNLELEKTTGNLQHRPPTPWWNEECRRRVQARRKAKKLVEKYPNEANLADLRKKTAEAKYTIIQSKKKSWRNYISSLSFDKPIGEIWKKIKTIQGKYVPQTYPIIVEGNHIIDNYTKAHHFKTLFQSTSELSTVNPPENVIEVINNTLNKHSTQQYNCPFNMSEFNTVKQELKNTSCGKDEIPNIFIKELPAGLSEELLYLFNTSWQMGWVPQAWKIAVTVPISKPGKLKSAVESYRPISLLPTIGKFMERLIKKRLEWVIEDNSLLSGDQYGFRKGKSTMDVILQVHQCIRSSLQTKEKLIIIYLDLKSAYDKIWHTGLLYKLAKCGIEGNMYKWLYSYLSDRSSNVRVGESLSEPMQCTSGVPQGAVLSPILFNIMLADMPVDPKIKLYTYADDITFLIQGKDMKILTRTMQLYVNKLVKWIEDWGMKVSETKSSCQVFTRSRDRNTIIRIKNFSIPQVKEQRLLGLIFDSPTLTWKSHIEYLINDIRKRIDLMKVLSSTNWGASFKTLKLFYIMYIRSKIDYGSCAYADAAEMHLQKLDKLQNSALRLMLGARKSSPVLSMEVEAYVIPLCLRRRFLIGKYYLALLRRPGKDKTAEELKVEHKLSESTCIPNCSLSNHPKEILRTCGIEKFRRVPLGSNDPVPPWFDIYDIVECSTKPQDIINGQEVIMFMHMKDHKYKNFQELYTDGSKIDLPQLSVASGVYIEYRRESICFRLNPSHSVVSSELFAIKEALNIIYREAQGKYVIFTDSLSAVQSILCKSPANSEITREIKQKLVEVINKGSIVKIQWIKAHCGIEGNEIADKTAKLGHENDRSVRYSLNHADLLLSLKKGVVELWDKYWKDMVYRTGRGTYLRDMRDNLRLKCWNNSRDRRVEVVMSRMRIGHVGLNHYLNRFGMSVTDLCDTCMVEETIDHFLIDCRKYMEARGKLRSTLSAVGVLDFGVKTLLGCCTLEKHKKTVIFNAMTSFLKATKQMHRL